MSLIFEEYVAQGIREVLRFELAPPDDAEFMAVGTAILQVALQRTYEHFDFPENWRNDPEAYAIFVLLTIEVMLSFGPKEHRQVALRGLLDDLKGNVSYTPSEPKTNREIEYRRHFDVYSRMRVEDRRYDPKRWGKVRAHTESELGEYLIAAADRAGRAFEQWRIGTPLRDIDA